MREAPSLSVIQALQDLGAVIRAYDPAGMTAARALLHDVHFSGNAYDAAAGAHALVIITEWDTFRALDFGKLATTMMAKTLVDLRNVYRSEDVTSHGFTYFSIGRPNSSTEQKLAAQ